MKAPRFWRADQPSIWPRLLAPLGQIYAHKTAQRAHQKPDWKAPFCVICIGNLTMGGAGKTPTALKIANELIKMGKSPVFLSRGYGGTLSGPVMVDAHSADEVGDEPLLLRTVAPVCVAHDRVAGAKLCSTQGFDVLIMDDGFQNPHLHKDLNIVVIDGGFGHGNERPFPAGPLRETLASGAPRAQACVIIGEDRFQQEQKMRAANPNLVVQRADLKAHADLAPTKAVAFAGIARPEKFFETAQKLGFDLIETRAFGDHHSFTAQEITELRDLARRHDAILLSTTKDAVRLPQETRQQVHTLKIELEWQGEDMLKPLLTKLFEA